MLLAMLSEPARLPLAPGVKVTLIVQLKLAARELPQLFVCVKSAELDPEIEIPVMERAALPEFDTVTVCTDEVDLTA